MTDEGPPLELLLRRIAETPSEFLADPVIGGTGDVHTLAVVHDLLRLYGAAVVDERLAGLGPAGGSRGRDDANRLRLLAVLAWLLADPWFLRGGRDPGAILGAMIAAAAELGPIVPADKSVRDPERREELARLALAGLSLRPAGESEAWARDRLTTLSTTERARVVAASRAAEERARAIREELARKAAEEAADKWGRE